MDHTTTDVRVDFKISNAKLASLIDEAGGILKFCKLNAIGYQDFADLFRFRRSPWRRAVVRGGDMTIIPRRTSARLAEIAGVSVDELFPKHLYPEPGKRRGDIKRHILLDSRAMLSLRDLSKRERRLEPGQEDEVFRGEMTAAIASALDTLEPRTLDVVRMRFGLDGEPEQTLDEISQAIGVSRERVRQIEQRGLRKLREPHVTRKLKQLL